MTEFKTKLQKLRHAKGWTQETVAERLGVTAQTVSKWERGLLSPDISLLPKIALLYQCSIDSLFDMDLIWSLEHRRELEAKIYSLIDKEDWEGIYRAWIQEIELNPDIYKNYTCAMHTVYIYKLYDKEHIEKVISLADHAEKCCSDNDTMNEIYRSMTLICSESDNPRIKAKADYYYKKIPLLRHSREVFAQCVMEGEPYRAQVRKTLFDLIDIAGCSIPHLIHPDMQPEEKISYYEKAIELYDVIFDGKYAGYFDVSVWQYYFEILKIYTALGETEKVAEYARRILVILERHTNAVKEPPKSPLLYQTSPPSRHVKPIEVHYRAFLSNLLAMSALEPFHEKIREIYQILIS